MDRCEIAGFTPSTRRNTFSEMREVIDALGAGKPIQFKYVGDGVTASWIDNRNTPPDFINCVYRVKPDETKKCWRPFRDVQEFVDAAGGLGAIWIRGRMISSLLKSRASTILNALWTKSGLILDG